MTRVGRRLRNALLLAFCAVIGLGVAARAAFATPDSASSVRSVEARSGLPDSLEWVPFIAPNGEEENYIRYLQLAGIARPYPWSLRGFSPLEARELTARVGQHPWSGAAPFTRGRARARVLPARLEIRHNASFPYGSNDGPVWAGRGMTLAFDAGVLMDAGPVSLVIAPLAFTTQNSAFSLLDNGQPGALRFADGIYPGVVDRPQRFGDGPYRRADPGNSTWRADVGPFAAGVSTANMVWGPSEKFPFILGTNAPGFLHGFLGTSRPLGAWLARIHARVLWGELQQTPYSPTTGRPTYFSVAEPGTRRFASGLIAVLQPRWTGGLELGLARFIHSVWPQSGIPRSYLRKPLQGLLKHGLPRDTPFLEDPQGGTDNQLFSAFARWPFPGVGIEIYGEYGREDHSWDKRDLLQEPDHARAYNLGLRSTIRARPDRIDGVTIELINFQLPHLARTGRGEGSIYIHSLLRQGHTNRGQLLGADVGVGAAAGFAARWDAYTQRGRTSFTIERTVRQERGAFYLGAALDSAASDVQYAVGIERLRLLGQAEVVVSTALIRELNRNFAGDAWSAATRLRVRVPLLGPR